MKIADSLRDVSQMRQARAFDVLRGYEEEENLRAWEQVAALAERLCKLEEGEDAAGAAGARNEVRRKEVNRVAKELQTLARKRLSFADELGLSDVDAITEMPSGMVAAATLSAEAPALATEEARAGSGVAAGAAVAAIAVAGVAGSGAVEGAAVAEPSAVSTNATAGADASDGHGAAWELGAAGKGAKRAAVLTGSIDADFARNAENTLEEDLEEALEEAVVPEYLQSDYVSEPGETAGQHQHQIPELHDDALQPALAQVATFKHVCAGRDGKLSLFEDADGHLVVVRSSRLAQ